jgi:Cdc6-like AAA superfamily ATPase
MILSHRFEPSSVDPQLLVDRKPDVDFLVEPLGAYLRDPQHQGVRCCVTGDKGCGKSILTRAALWRLRQEFSDRTLFLDVNCRERRAAKRVFQDIATKTVDALEGLRRATVEVPPELFATAQMLARITGWDTVARKDVYERLVVFKSDAELRGESALLGVLKSKGGISFERAEKTASELAGEIKFDDQLVREMVTALFRDLRRSGLEVIVYLDNLDELRHQYHTAEEREVVRRDVEELLLLQEAPIALVVNARTYFSSILSREIRYTKVLERLPDEEMLRALKVRLEQEPDEVKAKVREKALREELDKLVRVAPTPLALLQWFTFLFDGGYLGTGRLREGLDAYLRTSYTTLRRPVLDAVAALFEHDPSTAMSQEDLLAAIPRQNQAVFKQLEDTQAILPVDFWNPIEFTLDPTLAFLVAARTGKL